MPRKGESMGYGVSRTWVHRSLFPFLSYVGNPFFICLVSASLQNGVTYRAPVVCHSLGITVSYCRRQANTRGAAFRPARSRYGTQVSVE